MYLCNVSQTGDMKKLATLLKLSFIVVGWIVFILLSYVAFKDEKQCSDNNEGQPT